MRIFFSDSLFHQFRSLASGKCQRGAPLADLGSWADFLPSITFSSLNVIEDISLMCNVSLRKIDSKRRKNWVKLGKKRIFSLLAKLSVILGDLV
jgi:hypothetical protein